MSKKTNKTNELQSSKLMNELFNATQEYDTLTNTVIIEIAKHLIIENELERFQKMLNKYGLSIRVNFQNIGSKTSVFTPNTIVVNGKQTSLINVYIDEFENPEELVLRLTKLIAQWFDWCVFMSLNNNDDSKYKFASKDYLSYKKALEMVKRVKNIDLKEHSKKGSKWYFAPGADVTWVSDLFNLENKITVTQKEKGGGATKPRYRLTWVTDCKECTAPKLATMVVDSLDDVVFPTFKCQHGHTWTLQAEKIESKGE